ncbi:hypothetical protein IMZ48_01885, partial [Candidatus Bathyarchaeota archaeon]|nr:hypothetical protein [Candidatus Bathyarchaeota archaeon]
MTAIGIPTIMVRLGDAIQWAFESDAGTENTNIAGAEKRVPKQPQDPLPTTPTEPQRAEGSEPGQEENIPAEISQQEDASKQATPAGVTGPEKGKEPAEPLEDDSDAVADDEDEWMRHPLPSALSPTPD